MLLDDLKVTAGPLAKRLGRMLSDLVHLVRLLELPDEATGLLDRLTRVTEGAPSEPDHQRRPALALGAAKEGWLVRRLEAERQTDAPRLIPREEPHSDHSPRPSNWRTRLSGRPDRRPPHYRIARGIRSRIDQRGAETLLHVLEGKKDEPSSEMCHVAHLATHTSLPASAAILSHTGAEAPRRVLGARRRGPRVLVAD
jgi:hypothetical protein